MQNHKTLHASTTWNGAMSRTIFRSLWPSFHSSFHIKGKFCLGYTLNTVFFCMISKLGIVSFIIVLFICHLSANIHHCETTINQNACSKRSFILHCVVFKIKLLTGVLCISTVLLLIIIVIFTVKYFLLRHVILHLVINNMNHVLRYVSDT